MPDAFTLFSTLAVHKSFKAGRREYKAGTAVWVMANPRTCPNKVPAGHVMIGKMRDHADNGQVFNESVLVDYVSAEL